MMVRYEIEPDEPPSVALATVVSTLLGKGPTEIEPLNEFVDLESIDRFFRSHAASVPWDPAVRLVLDTHVLTIDESEIVVEPAGGPDSDPLGTGGVRTTGAGAEPTDGEDEDRTLDGSMGAGGRGDGAGDPNVLLLAPSDSAAETETCTELLPDGAAGDAATLELTFGPTSSDLGRICVDTVETLRRWGERCDEVGLCIDSLSALIRRSGLESTYRFLLLLTWHVSRMDVVAHYHADPNEHDLETTYLLESLVDAIVVTGDVEISPTGTP